jgi:hypothetical protein
MSSSFAERASGSRSVEPGARARPLARSRLFGGRLRLPYDPAPNPEFVGVLLGSRLEDDPTGKDSCPLFQTVCLDDVHRSKRGGASLVGAAGAEEMCQLEHERDEIDRDQEREEELDVPLDAGICPLDLLERCLAREKVAVSLDRADPA